MLSNQLSHHAGNVYFSSQILYCEVSQKEGFNLIDRYNSVVWIIEKQDQ